MIVVALNGTVYIYQRDSGTTDMVKDIYGCGCANMWSWLAASMGNRESETPDLG